MERMIDWLVNVFLNWITLEKVNPLLAWIVFISGAVVVILTVFAVFGTISRLVDGAKQLVRTIRFWMIFRIWAYDLNLEEGKIVQKTVNQELESRAKHFIERCKLEKELLQQTNLGAYKKNRAALLKNKRAFWTAHAAAKGLGYFAYDSAKKYAKEYYGVEEVK